MSFKYIIKYTPQTEIRCFNNYTVFCVKYLAFM